MLKYRHRVLIVIRHLKRKIFLNFEALSNINKYDPTSIYQKSPDILPMLKKSLQPRVNTVIISESLILSTSKQFYCSNFSFILKMFI